MDKPKKETARQQKDREFRLWQAALDAKHAKASRPVVRPRFKGEFNDFGAYI